MEWHDLARERLTECVAQVKAVDAIKTEAERIAAALRAAAIEVPALPWAVAATPGKRGKLTFPTCRKCGRQFSGTRQYRGSLAAGAECRDGCPPADGR